MKKTINLPKIAYNGSRKINAVTIDISLEDGNLSLIGNVWNARRTDVTLCGQIYKELRNLYPHNSQVQSLVAVWKRWHFNDMRAGSPAQEAYLRANPVKAVYPESHYDKASAALAAVGLNPDNGYKYGSAWLKEELPAEIVAFIEGL